MKRVHLLILFPLTCLTSIHIKREAVSEHSPTHIVSGFDTKLEYQQLNHSSNMKQKIVMKVHMNCQKCRTKVLKVVAAANGVNFVGLEGEGKDKVVVMGDGVDAVKLTRTLRKKIGQTDILSLAEVKSS